MGNTLLNQYTEMDMRARQLSVMQSDVGVGRRWAVGIGDWLGIGGSVTFTPWTELDRTAWMSDISEFLFPSWAISNVTIIKRTPNCPQNAPYPTPPPSSYLANLLHSWMPMQESLWQLTKRNYIVSCQVWDSVGKATASRILFMSILISTFHHFQWSSACTLSELLM